MTLGELIARLEQHDPDKVVKHGFNNPHAYRGYYDDLAFEPAENVQVGYMLMIARECVDRTFGGWKGGEYTMKTYTDVWLAERGDTGEMLSDYAMRYILGEE